MDTKEIKIILLMIVLFIVFYVITAPFVSFDGYMNHKNQMLENPDRSYELYIESIELLEYKYKKGYGLIGKD